MGRRSARADPRGRGDPPVRRRRDRHGRPAGMPLPDARRLFHPRLQSFGTLFQRWPPLRFADTEPRRVGPGDLRPAGAVALPLCRGQLLGAGQRHRARGDRAAQSADVQRTAAPRAAGAQGRQRGRGLRCHRRPLAARERMAALEQGSARATATVPAWRARAGNPPLAAGQPAGPGRSFRAAARQPRRAVDKRRGQRPLPVP